jgi:hypothetical protein
MRAAPRWYTVTGCSQRFFRGRGDHECAMLVATFFGAGSLRAQHHRQGERALRPRVDARNFTRRFSWNGSHHQARGLFFSCVKQRSRSGMDKQFSPFKQRKRAATRAYVQC